MKQENPYITDIEYSRDKFGEVASYTNKDGDRVEWRGRIPPYLASRTK